MESNQKPSQFAALTEMFKKGAFKLTKYIGDVKISLIILACKKTLELTGKSHEKSR
jgi:hypothetical protein